MTIAIIIARGGSKRLPRKNVLPFCGHPLVAWPIVNARCSKLIDAVYVSTDDDEIEQVAREYGAEVIRRPDWPDADQVSANRPFRHAITILLEMYGDRFDTVLPILPTSPVCAPGDLDLGIGTANKYGILELLPMIYQRETVLYFRSHEFVCRLWLLDKEYTYLRPGPAWSVTRPRHFIRYTAGYSEMDKEIETIAREPNKLPRIECHFIPVPIWQAIEIDTEPEFEFGQIIFEHYVLKGKGMEVFYEYAKS
jgi:hypothetical protein